MTSARELRGGGTLPVLSDASRAIAMLGTLGALSGAPGTVLGASTPHVWVIDDGEKIRRDATATPFERGDENPVWRPGQPARLFAMRGESIAFQVVVHAGDMPLDSVSVELRDLVKAGDPDGPRISERSVSRAEAGRIVGRPVERFVEHFVPVERESGGPTAGESLGWERGAGPPAGTWIGPVPDALIPVELAPPWLPYPMRIDPETNGIVWVDLNVPGNQPPAAYVGAIDVTEHGRSLASIPLELEVADARLPDEAARALVYYDPEELLRRVGPAAEEHAWKILHAHRVAPLHDATSPEDVHRQRSPLDGSLYAPSQGYFGPRPLVGDGILGLGVYGSLGDVGTEVVARVRAIAAAVADEHLFGTTEVILYADDEACTSPRGAAWRAALRASDDPNMRRIRVAWTCSDDPRDQPVDVPMLLAAAFDPGQLRGASARGQEAWIYNGVLPHTGTFLLDAPAVSPRVNGFLGGMFHVPRWFYWESTLWYGDHGRTPQDPFADAESLHNADGDWANGDGVLVYPGRQLDAFPEHSLGFEGVVPSIRLKNWRRGLQDAAYLELARSRDRARAEAIGRALIPGAFRETKADSGPAWSPRGKPFFDARRALLAVALGPLKSETREARAVPAGAANVPSPAVRAAWASAIAAGAMAVAWGSRGRGRRRAHRTGRTGPARPQKPN